MGKMVGTKVMDSVYEVGLVFGARHLQAGPVEGHGGQSDLCGNDAGEKRCRRRGLGCGIWLFSGVSVGLPWLVCCYEVEAAVADDDWQQVVRSVIFRGASLAWFYFAVLH
jgi:hypothetical protein